MIDASISNSKTWFAKKPFKVIVCTVTAMAFFINIFSYELISINSGKAWAAVKPAGPTGVGPELAGGSALTIDPATFTLPEALGIIRDAWSPSSTPRRSQRSDDSFARGEYELLPPVVIHIQDAHCNYYAQKKIAEIIAYLNKERGISTVNLEGGAESYDMSPLTDILTPDDRERVADDLVREGIANGAEYFEATNPGKLNLWGIEDTGLYIENLNTWRSFLQYKPDADKYVKNISFVLNNLKVKIYSKALLEFDTNYSAYKAGNLDFKDYVSYLVTTAGRQGIALKAYPNVELLQDTINEESDINFKRADIERDDLMDRLQKKLPRIELEELVMKTVAFKQDAISQKDFYAYLAGKARSLGIKMDEFPSLNSYISYVGAYHATDKFKLMAELEKLEDAIKSSLYENAEQRDLSQLSKNLAITKNIFSISLTGDDYRYYKQNEKDFVIARYVSFIKSRAPPLKIDAKLDPDVGKLDEYRAMMGRFYELSFARDEAFLRNLKFPRDTQYPIRNTNAAIVVTGGFHTDNLARLFREKGIPYISIMPSFTTSDGYECPYFKLISGETKIDVSAYITADLNKAIAIPDQFSPAMVAALKRGTVVSVAPATGWRRTLALAFMIGALGTGFMAAPASGQAAGVSPAGTTELVSPVQGPEHAPQLYEMPAPETEHEVDRRITDFETALARYKQQNAEFDTLYRTVIEERGVEIMFRNVDRGFPCQFVCAQGQSGTIIFDIAQFDGQRPGDEMVVALGEEMFHATQAEGILERTRNIPTVFLRSYARLLASDIWTAVRGRAQIEDSAFRYKETIREELGLPQKDAWQDLKDFYASRRPLDIIKPVFTLVPLIMVLGLFYGLVKGVLKLARLVSSRPSAKWDPESIPCLSQGPYKDGLIAKCMKARLMVIAAGNGYMGDIAPNVELAESAEKAFTALLTAYKGRPADFEKDLQAIYEELYNDPLLEVKASGHAYTDKQRIQRTMLNQAIKDLVKIQEQAGAEIARASLPATVRIAPVPALLRQQREATQGFVGQAAPATMSVKYEKFAEDYVSKPAEGAPYDVNMRRSEALSRSTGRIHNMIKHMLETDSGLTEGEISYIMGEIFAHLIPNAVDAVYANIDKKMMAASDAIVSFGAARDPNIGNLKLTLSDNGGGMIRDFSGDKQGSSLMGGAGQGIKIVLDKAWHKNYTVSFVSRRGDKAFIFTQGIDSERTKTITDTTRPEEGTDVIINIPVKAVPAAPIPAAKEIRAQTPLAPAHIELPANEPAVDVQEGGGARITVKVWDGSVSITDLATDQTRVVSAPAELGAPAPVVDGPHEEHNIVFEMLKNLNDRGGIPRGKRVLVLNFDEHSDKFGQSTEPLSMLSTWARDAEDIGWAYVPHFQSMVLGHYWNKDDERARLLKEIDGYRTNGEISEVWVTIDYDFFNDILEKSPVDKNALAVRISEITEFLKSENMRPVMVVPVISRSCLPDSVSQADIDNVTQTIRSAFTLLAPARKGMLEENIVAWLLKIPLPAAFTRLKSIDAIKNPMGTPEEIDGLARAFVKEYQLGELDSLNEHYVKRIKEFIGKTLAARGGAKHVSRSRLTSRPSEQAAGGMWLDPDRRGAAMPIDTSAFPGGFIRFFIPKGSAYGSKWDAQRNATYEISLGDPRYTHMGMDFLQYEAADGSVKPVPIPINTPILSLCNGTVKSVGADVVIETLDGKLVIYKHIFSSSTLSVGRKIGQGDTIGTFTNRPAYQPPVPGDWRAHLHLEVLSGTYSELGDAITIGDREKLSKAALDPFSVFPGLINVSKIVKDDTIDAGIVAAAPIIKTLVQTAVGHSYDDPTEFAGALGCEDAVPFNIAAETQPELDMMINAIKEGKGVLIDMSKLPRMITKENVAYASVCISRISGYIGSKFPHALDRYLGYSINEVLKNAFYHGNKLNRRLPILLTVQLNKDGGIGSFEVYDRVNRRPWNPFALIAARRARVAGTHIGELEIKRLGFTIERSRVRDGNGALIGNKTAVKVPSAIKADPVPTAPSEADADKAERRRVILMISSYGHDINNFLVPIYGFARLYDPKYLMKGPIGDLRDALKAIFSIPKEERIKPDNKEIPGLIYSLRNALLSICVLKEDEVEHQLFDSLGLQGIDKMPPEYLGIIRGRVRLIKDLAEEFEEEWVRRRIIRVNEAIDVNAILRRCVAPYIKITEIKPRMDLTDKPFSLVGDGIQMERVFENLVRNAVQAMGNQADKKLTISTLLAPGNRLEIIIEDNGPGVPAEEQGRIFEPYYTTKADGNGLGLAIVRRIVEEHGGMITLTSSPGQGAKFKVTLPLQPPAPAPDAPAVAEIPAAGPQIGGSYDEFEKDSLALWMAFNGKDAGAGSRLEDLLAGLKGQGYIVLRGNSQELDKAKTMLLEKAGSSVKERYVLVNRIDTAVRYFSENVQQRGGEEGILLGRIDNETNKAYISVIGKGPGFPLEHDSFVTEDGRFVIDPRGTGRLHQGLPRVLSRVEDLTIYSDGLLWRKSSPKTVKSQAGGVEGALVAAKIDLSAPAQAVLPVVGPRHEQAAKLLEFLSKLKPDSTNPGGVHFSGIKIYKNIGASGLVVKTGISKDVADAVELAEARLGGKTAPFAAVRHDNNITVIQQYLPTLKEEIEKGGLSREEIRKLLSMCYKLTSDMLELGVVHWDPKLENYGVVKINGKVSKVKLIDIGGLVTAEKFIKDYAVNKDNIHKLRDSYFWLFLHKLTEGMDEKISGMALDAAKQKGLSPEDLMATVVERAKVNNSGVTMAWPDMPNPDAAAPVPVSVAPVIAPPAVAVKDVTSERKTVDINAYSSVVGRDDVVRVVVAVDEDLNASADKVARKVASILPTKGFGDRADNRQIEICKIAKGASAAQAEEGFKKAIDRASQDLPEGGKIIAFVLQAGGEMDIATKLSGIYCPGGKIGNTIIIADRYDDLSAPDITLRHALARHIASYYKYTDRRDSEARLIAALLEKVTGEAYNPNTVIEDLVRLIRTLVIKPVVDNIRDWETMQTAVAVAA